MRQNKHRVELDAGCARVCAVVTRRGNGSRDFSVPNTTAVIKLISDD
jgi:hypothetical protein